MKATASSYSALLGMVLRSPALWLLIVSLTLMGPLYLGLNRGALLRETTDRSLVYEIPTHLPRGITWSKQLDFDRVTQPTKAIPAPDFDHIEGFFGPTSSSQVIPLATSPLDLRTLDSAYQLLLPFLALMLGIIVLPQSGRVLRLMRSAPMPRSLQFVVLSLAVGTVLVLLLAMQVIATGITTLCLDGTLSTAVPLLHYHGILFLYICAFAALGLLLAAIARHRSTALLVGVLLCALCTVVLPVTYVWTFHAYMTANYELVREAMLARRPLYDPLYLLIRASSYQPTSLFRSCSSLLRVVYHDPLHPTQPRQINQLQYDADTLANNLRSLVWKLGLWPAGFLLVGAFAYARKEAWTDA